MTERGPLLSREFVIRKVNETWIIFLHLELQNELFCEIYRANLGAKPKDLAKPMMLKAHLWNSDLGCVIFTDYCKRRISDIDSKCCAQIKRSHARPKSPAISFYDQTYQEVSNFFRLLAAVLVKRLLRRVLVYCQIEYLESYLYLAGVAITSNSSFPGPLGGVCGWTRSKWSLILRELCLLLFLVKLYWTESTPLLTNYFSSAVSIVEDRYLYFAVWRRKDRITSKFPGNLVTNVTTRNKRDNFISDQ